MRRWRPTMRRRSASRKSPAGLEKGRSVGSALAEGVRVASADDSACASIHVASMPDLDDFDDAMLIVDRVNDAILALSNSKRHGFSAEFLAPRRSWILA